MTSSRIALLVGGPAETHNASLSAASDILEQPATPFQPVRIMPDGQWRLYPSALGYSADTPQQILAPDQILTQLPYLYDAALIALSGEYSSDGQLQRLLDRAGLPYQGTGPKATARIWNTAGIYQSLRRIGFHIPSYLAMSRTEWVVARGRKLRQIVAAMGSELTIRPNHPHAIDFRLVSSPAQLADAIEEMSVRHDRFIVQRRLKSIEVDCAVIETEAGAVPGEPVLADGRLLTPDVTLALQNMALRVYQVLGLRDYGLIRLLVAHRRIWVTEVETLPSLSRSGPFAASALGLGWSYPDLVSHLAGRAMSRPEVIELHESYE